MKHYITMGVLSLILFSCGSNAGEKSTLWVSGFQAACEDGTEDVSCLWVNPGSDPEQGQWERMEAPIEGFAFEPGYLKQIEVSVETSEQESRYTLVREIEKKEDVRMALSGIWTWEGEIAPEGEDQQETPTFEISLPELRVFGTDGCNRYFGPVTQLTGSSLSFGQLGSTRRMCANMEIPDRFMADLLQTAAYRLENQRLALLDGSGQVLLTFKRTDQE